MRAALALALLAGACVGCCDPKGQFELVATVVDGPTGQFIPMPFFGGVAAYAKCQSFFGQTEGAGGGGQNTGPCVKWLVYADEKGGDIKVGADGFEEQTFTVPKASADACGPPDSKTKTFRLKRK